MKNTKQYLWIEIGANLIALFLPLVFNPFATRPFDGIKVMFVWIVVASMAILTALTVLYNHKYSLTYRKKSTSAALAKLKEDNPLLIPVMIYSGVYTLAALTSIDPSLSFLGANTRLGTITVLSLVFLFILVTYAIRENSQIDRLVSALLVGSIPVAIYGWVQYLELDPLDWITATISPVYSTAGYSLYLGAYLATVIPFTISRVVISFRGKRNRLYSYLVVLFLQVTCLLFTLSRGAWLGLLGGCLLFLWLMAYRWKKKSLIILSIGVLVVGGFLFVLMNHNRAGASLITSDDFLDIPDLRSLRASISSRIHLWQYTIPIIANRYLLGYGPETYYRAFWINYPPKSYPELLILDAWDPHNLFLYHLTAIGVLGLLAFLWVLFKFYMITLNSILHGEDSHSTITTAAILSSVTAFLIQAQFNPSAILPLAIFWLILALGISVYRKDAKQLVLGRNGFVSESTMSPLKKLNLKKSVQRSCVSKTLEKPKKSAICD